MLFRSIRNRYWRTDDSGDWRSGTDNKTAYTYTIPSFFHPLILFLLSFTLFPALSFHTLSRSFTLFPALSCCFPLFHGFLLFPAVSRCFPLFHAVSCSFTLFPAVSCSFPLFPALLHLTFFHTLRHLRSPTCALSNMCALRIARSPTSVLSYMLTLQNPHSSILALFETHVLFFFTIYSLFSHWTVFFGVSRRNEKWDSGYGL